MLPAMVFLTTSDRGRQSRSVCSMVAECGDIALKSTEMSRSVRHEKSERQPASRASHRSSAMIVQAPLSGQTSEMRCGGRSLLSSVAFCGISISSRPKCCARRNKKSNSAERARESRREREIESCDVHAVVHKIEHEKYEREQPLSDFSVVGGAPTTPWCTLK